MVTGTGRPARGLGIERYPGRTVLGNHVDPVADGEEPCEQIDRFDLADLAKDVGKHRSRE